MRYFTFLIPLVLFLSFCSKNSANTKPALEFPYSIKVGDSWMMKAIYNDSIYDIKYIVEQETIINNLPFYKIKDTLNALNNGAFYVHASDSIVMGFYLDQTPQNFVIFRVIHPNARVGDIWIDSLISSCGWILKIESSLKAVDVVEDVPAGQMKVYKTEHIFKAIPQNIIVGKIELSINKDVIFVRKLDIDYGLHKRKEVKLISYDKS
ncbi:MAG: hypothetical protein ABIL49_04055 [candidate division WOR-3 bacterium]